MTDEALLQKTGGILQGMSGSPLVQNGMLVGAVTHVFVDEPDRGYAIFAETVRNAEKKPRPNHPQCGIASNIGKYWRKLYQKILKYMLKSFTIYGNINSTAGFHNILGGVFTWRTTTIC